MEKGDARMTKIKPEPLKGKTCRIPPDDWEVHSDDDIREAVEWLKEKLLKGGYVYHHRQWELIDEAFEDVVK